MARARRELGVTNETSSDLLGYLRYAQELMADVPEEDWEEVPTDLAQNHEHYLYDSPKQRQ